VQLAVDDFGTGYSSLSYLRRFSIDTLKIDQSFVRQIAAGPDETTIVAAVIGMGRSLRLRVVAEGVETREELAFLQAQQCDEAQGYYFSRPVLPAEFAQLLESGIPKANLNSLEPDQLDEPRHRSSGVMPIGARESDGSTREPSVVRNR
jgi:EAL domain-containing protein (putative c-di-GMP-specific phosphodiesterase class I)